MTSLLTTSGRVLRRSFGGVSSLLRQQQQKHQTGNRLNAWATTITSTPSASVVLGVRFHGHGPDKDAKKYVVLALLLLMCSS
jgi:hypothetical protein